MRDSLVAPTDNAVAQARWMQSKLTGVEIDDEIFNLPLNFEARCAKALNDKRWNDARLECSKWLLDEPYSSRPAKIGSFIGISLTTEFEFAISCAKAGLQADPDNVHLLNNLSVALAYEGKIFDAIDEFKKIDPLNDKAFPEYVLTATKGLLLFRSGDFDGGRKFYSKAEQLAPTEYKHRVVLYQAREELYAKTKEAPKYLEKALSYKPKKDDIEIEQMQTMLRVQIRDFYNPKTHLEGRE